MKALFQPLQLGDLELPNRFVMAPLTRCRATMPGNVPNALNALYYAQRASAGLIISEATDVSPMSCAFEGAPGIFTDEQVEGWRPVVSAVHDEGGRFFCQLWHAGRVSNSEILKGRAPLAPSFVDGIKALQVYAQDEARMAIKVDASLPQEMSDEDIQRTIREYGTAAANARRAGFDGVEVHAANGYLPHQFLSAGTNLRNDAYGGSTERRCRFIEEILRAVLEQYPANKVGIRLSPTAKYNDVQDPSPGETYRYLSKLLNELGVVYIHIADTNAWAGNPDLPELLSMIKPGFSGTILVNGGILPDQAEGLVTEGAADLVAFGRPFIANPDLPERVKAGAPLAEPIPEYFYGGGDGRGYTDYPTMDGTSRPLLSKQSQPGRQDN